jgi:hypothetical protein
MLQILLGVTIQRGKYLSFMFLLEYFKFSMQNHYFYYAFYSFIAHFVVSNVSLLDKLINLFIVFGQGGSFSNGIW